MLRVIDHNQRGPRAATWRARAAGLTRPGTVHGVKGQTGQAGQRESPAGARRGRPAAACACAWKMGTAAHARQAGSPARDKGLLAAWHRSSWPRGHDTTTDASSRTPAVTPPRSHAAPSLPLPHPSRSLGTRALPMRAGRCCTRAHAETTHATSALRGRHGERPESPCLLLPARMRLTHTCRSAEH